MYYIIPLPALMNVHGHHQIFKIQTYSADTKICLLSFNSHLLGNSTLQFYGSVEFYVLFEFASSPRTSNVSTQ